MIFIRYIFSVSNRSIIFRGQILESELCKNVDINSTALDSARILIGVTVINIISKGNYHDSKPTHTSTLFLQSLNKYQISRQLHFIRVSKTSKIDVQ